MKNLTLTKELLLKYASHKSVFVREAAYARIAAEMLKEKGLLSFEDISFQGNLALDVYLYYKNLSNYAFQTENGIESYKKVILQDKENKEIIALELLSAPANAEITDFICEYIGKIKPGSCERMIICALLEHTDNEKFIQLATERLKYFDNYYMDIIDAINKVAETNLNLVKDISEVLKGKERWITAKVIDFYVNVIRNPEFKNTPYTDVFLNHLMTCLEKMKYDQEKEVAKVNEKLLKLHRDGLISDTVLQKIIFIELINFVEGYDSFVLDLLKILLSLINKDISIAVRQQVVLQSLSIKRLSKQVEGELLFIICQIINLMKKHQMPQANIEEYENIFFRLVSGTKYLTKNQFGICVGIWVKQGDWHKLQQLIKASVPNQYLELIYRVAENNPKWLDDVFPKINLRLIENKEAVVSLFIWLGNKFEENRANMIDILQKYLNENYFSISEAKAIKNILNKQNMLSEINIEAIQEDEDVDEILNLLSF